MYSMFVAQRASVCENLALFTEMHQVLTERRSHVLLSFNCFVLGNKKNHQERTFYHRPLSML